MLMNLFLTVDPLTSSASDFPGGGKGNTRIYSNFVVRIKVGIKMSER